MKVFALIALLVTVGAVAAPPQNQDGGIKHIKPKVTATVGNGPVTHAEAEAVLTKLRDLMADCLEYPALKKVPSLTPGTGLVTRDEVVLVLDRFAEAAKPTFKIGTPPIPIEPTAIVSKKPMVRDAMVRLVKGAFANRIGVLMCGPADSIEVIQMGDAVGFFLCRIAELSHVPSIRWSPYLQKED